MSKLYVKKKIIYTSIDIKIKSSYKKHHYSYGTFSQDIISHIYQTINK